MDGTAIIYIVIGLLLLLGIERYLSWRDWDAYRRLTRKAHVNLMRGLR